MSDPNSPLRLIGDTLGFIALLVGIIVWICVLT